MFPLRDDFMGIGKCDGCRIITISMKRIIEHTADGSATLYVPAMDEHYHSVKGARTESQHIFIDMGLKATTANPVEVLEIGFGT